MQATVGLGLPLVGNLVLRTQHRACGRLSVIHNRINEGWGQLLAGALACKHENWVQMPNTYWKKKKLGMAITLALNERSKHLLASLPSRNVNLLIQWEDNMGESNKEDTVHPALTAVCAHVGVTSTVICACTTYNTAYTKRKNEKEFGFNLIFNVSKVGISH